MANKDQNLLSTRTYNKKVPLHRNSNFMHFMSRCHCSLNAEPI